MPLSGKPAAEKKEQTELMLVRATVAIMNELVDIMGLEVDLVTARKLEEHKALLKRKQRLTMDYRANMKTIAADPGFMKKLPEEVIAATRAAAQKLADMSDRNAKCLRGAVVATQRLIQNIVSIVKQEVLPKPGYSNPGTAVVGAAAYSPTCKPVAITRMA